MTTLSERAFHWLIVQGKKLYLNWSILVCMWRTLRGCEARVVCDANVMREGGMAMDLLMMRYMMVWRIIARRTSRGCHFNCPSRRDILWYEL